jgi:rhodanese-related sulfurtransferase
MRATITPEQAFSLLQEDPSYVLVDVRSAAEYRELHAEQAIHIPLEQILEQKSLSTLNNKKALCICQSGMRGEKAVEALLKNGITEVRNVEGGTRAWKNARLPIVEGEKCMSIERQVRSLAGALVLGGSLAGLLISPYFFAVPLFVGSGLLFAGITDTCGMALLLAKCPWNK